MSNWAQHRIACLFSSLYLFFPSCLHNYFGFDVWLWFFTWNNFPLLLWRITFFPVFKCFSKVQFSQQVLSMHIFKFNCLCCCLFRLPQSFCSMCMSSIPNLACMIMEGISITYLMIACRMPLTDSECWKPHYLLVLSRKEKHIYCRSVKPNHALIVTIYFCFYLPMCWKAIRFTFCPSLHQFYFYCIITILIPTVVLLNCKIICALNIAAFCPGICFKLLLVTQLNKRERFR